MRKNTALRYQMGEPIESGTQGQVVSAIDSLTNKPVAIKIFQISNQSGAAGFACEYLIHKIMKGNSSGICTVLDAFQIPNSLGFIVMEKYKQDLFSLAFGSQQKLNTRQVKNIFKKVCKGVRDLHRKGVAHLDLKPENILVDNNQNTFICDFGCSYVYDDEGEYPKKMSRKLRKTIFENLRGRGTRKYAAPEVFSEDEFNPFSADIYSLGILLHALTTGFFPATNQKNCIVSLELVKTKVDKDIFKLMCSMLMNDPTKRPTIETIMKSKYLKGKREKVRKQTAKMVHFASI